MNDRRFTTIQIPLKSGIMGRLKAYQKQVESESEIPGVKVPLYAAVDHAVRTAQETKAVKKTRKAK